MQGGLAIIKKSKRLIKNKIGICQKKKMHKQNMHVVECTCHKNLDAHDISMARLIKKFLKSKNSNKECLLTNPQSSQ
jgi:hypothetical protein